MSRSMAVKALSILALAAAAFLAGRHSGAPKSSGAGSGGGRRILYYHDPMHPAYRSGKPGIAPDCGMQLEPVYEDGGEALPPGGLQVSPEKQQLIGIRTERAIKGLVMHKIRVPGRVALDETRVFRVAAAVEGWVRSAGPIAAGSLVRKDEVLATFYNRDFLTAQQTYLYALNTMDRFKDKESEEQLKLTRAQMISAEENLEFLGMGKLQLQEVARTRQVARNIELRSPVSGLVLARNTYPGLRFERGAELFRIADLDQVWIFADVFENDARLLGGLRSATVHYQGSKRRVRISDALPQFDAATRVLKVRLETGNPNFALRPDMFVDVEFEVGLPAAIMVPVDAVLDSGRRRTVFVDSGGGRFETREVETGWRFGDRIQIVRGLQQGESFVTAGNFLLDSESRIQRAAAPASFKDPVCGMQVEPAKAAGKSEFKGETYYFCGKSCKQQFDRDPGRYTGVHAASMAPGGDSVGPGGGMAGGDRVP